MPENEKISKLYLSSVLLFMLLLPLSSTYYTVYFSETQESLIGTVGKWFVFWGIGARLLTAGLRQVAKPGFTAEKIFRLKNAGAGVIVRELGFANICFGLTAIMSLWIDSWRPVAAFSGGLYFAMAGALHVVKRPVSANEWVALVSDVFIAVIAAIYLSDLFIL